MFLEEHFFLQWKVVKCKILSIKSDKFNNKNLTN